MLSEITFILDGRPTTVTFTPESRYSPTTTVLNFLRSLPTHKGVKEGCAEGDCGACTVVLGEPGDSGHISYKAIDSCLVFLPMLHGKELVTVENLRGDDGALHPVQQAMVDSNGSQCGFCTPGIVMSLFALYKEGNRPTRPLIDDALTGNLCRCTGYKPIVEAAAHACVHDGVDHYVEAEPKSIELLRSIPRRSLSLHTARQRYFQPTSLHEALELKRDHPEAVVINGATDVALRVTKSHELIKEVIDLSAVSDLRACSSDVESLTLGAGCTLSEVMNTIGEDFPALREMLAVFGSRQIRNLATLGGNLGTASPIGDTLPVLMAYNARVMLASLEGMREVPMNEFVTGYRKTARQPEELITSVVLPRLPAGTIVRSYKVSKRKDLDISTVSGGFRLQLARHNNVVESVRLAYGGMAELVRRARGAEQFLIGKKWERETVEQAMPLIESEFTPIADARSGSEFRTVVARNLLLKFWNDTQTNGLQ